MAPYPKVIPPNALDLTPAQAEFQKHFSDIVGNAASNSDGFETLFSPAVEHVADVSGFLSGFDSDLAGIGADANELRFPLHQDFADSLASTISQGQPTFNAFAVHLTGQNPPQSGPAPAPPGGTPTPAPAPQVNSFQLVLNLVSRPPQSPAKILFNGEIVQ